ncbi:hypothetical protein AN958_01246 [Leucoagaricus sp. SymC.cos]|nr:hypothetical protein AN958_01246 [Leucoagaricus sp. SymC.cos]
MPRIRKKTSNRQSTNDRRKIQRKVRESRKKKAKEAKKNPQWKSKHKKDPGIPNDFPYKDQILAEVAEQRRQAVEEKEKRKEEKRLARQQAKPDSQISDNEDAQDGGESLDSSKKNLDVGSDAIASLSAKIINPKLTTKEKKQAEKSDNIDVEEDIPILVNRDLPTLKTVLDVSDVLLEVLDARDPLPFRSSFLEKAMEGKKVILVLNKIDLCPREALTSWLAFLRRDFPTFLFRSATAFLPVSLEVTTSVQGKGKGKASIPKNDALGAEAILAQLSSWAGEKQEGSSLSVAVTGLTNAGKSSFVNSLLQRASLPVYSLPTSSRGPSTTTFPQEVTIDSNGKSIRFIDTPGLIWSIESESADAKSLEGLRARDILLRSKGRIDRLKDPSDALAHIVERANTEDLMLMYNIPAFTIGDTTAFLSGVARSNHLVKKRGLLDLAGASKIVLRDWNIDKFARYTSPPTIDAGQQLPSPTEADEKILNLIKTRRELRKEGRLVKLSTSQMEKRSADLEKSWEAENGIDDDNGGVDYVDEEEQGVEGGSEEDEEASQDEDDEESGDDDIQGEAAEEGEKEVELNPPKTFNQKRKRAVSFVSAQPAKKVAFISQKQDKPVQASAATKKTQENKELKSIMKKTTPAVKQKTLKFASLSKSLEKASVRVANVSSTYKNKAGRSNDPDDYDFSKFF